MLAAQKEAPKLELVAQLRLLALVIPGTSYCSIRGGLTWREACGWPAKVR